MKRELLLVGFRKQISWDAQTADYIPDPQEAHLSIAMRLHLILAGECCGGVRLRAAIILPRIGQSG